MKRIARNVLTGLSALLCIVAATVWLTQTSITTVLHQGNGGIAGPGTDPTYGICVFEGKLGIGWTYTDAIFEHHQGIALLWIVLPATILPAMSAMHLSREVRMRRRMNR